MENKKGKGCKDEFNKFVLKHGVKAVGDAVYGYKPQEGDGSNLGCQPPSGGCGTGEIFNPILCKCQDDIGFNPGNEK
jgi:hypothetical protein